MICLIWLAMTAAASTLTSAVTIQSSSTTTATLTGGCTESQTSSCSNDVQTVGLGKMNGNYPLPYNMTWTGNSTQSVNTAREDLQMCGYYPQLGSSISNPMRHCYFEAAIDAFCNRTAGSSYGTFLSNLSAIYDLTRASTDAKIWISLSMKNSSYHPECSNRTAIDQYGFMSRGVCRTMLLSLAVNSCMCFCFNSPEESLR